MDGKTNGGWHAGGFSFPSFSACGWSVWLGLRERHNKILCTMYALVITSYVEGLQLYLYFAKVRAEKGKGKLKQMVYKWYPIGSFYKANVE